MDRVLWNTPEKKAQAVHGYFGKEIASQDVIDLGRTARYFCARFCSEYLL